jgi:L-threonylcarbamoyladenylate synthase
MPAVTILPADLAGLAAAAERLLAGKIVCFPTESFYALGVPAVGGALDEVLRAKGRPPSQPIACLAASAEVAARVWQPPVPPRALALAERHWPGALTIVAPGIAGLHASLLGPAGIGVRVSSHPIVQALARLWAAKAKGPAAVLTATSANRTGEPPARTVAEARRRLDHVVDFYLDGGQTAGGPPSTVIEVLASGGARVVREGAVKLSAKELE